MTQPSAEGVLLVAHGTVTSLDEMQGFLTAIRRGRAASPELVDEMRRRYRAIGGSPLLTTTSQQARALSERLGKPVFVGMRFSEPTIEQALAEAEQQGVTRVVVVPMAPYSVKSYFEEICARRRNMSGGGGRDRLQLQTVPPFGSDVELVRAHSALIRGVAGEAIRAGASVVLSAHSLPMRVIEAGDSYGIETRQCADAIGVSLGIPIELAYQSQGKDGGRWLGPDLTDVLTQLAAAGKKQVVVAPFGFLCDHVETLFDLDIELRAHADALGLELCRVPTLGLEPALIGVLAKLVEQALLAAPTDPGMPEVLS